MGLKNVIADFEQTETVVELYTLGDLLKGKEDVRKDMKRLHIRKGSTELFGHDYIGNYLTPNDIADLRKSLRNRSDSAKTKAILQVIEGRAKIKDPSVNEKLFLIKLYEDFPAIADPKRATYWKNSLITAAYAKKLSLEHLFVIATFHVERKEELKKDFWLKQLLSYLKEHPTLENFKTIADWCSSKSIIFLTPFKGPYVLHLAAAVLAYQLYTELTPLLPKEDFGQERSKKA